MNVVFEEESARPQGDVALVVTLDGFAGPLDLLLSLARDQKVDLRQISILALAEQYLAYIAEARRHRLEVAADYLVMAAWLAYLKSRLLLPPTEKPGEEEPSGEELAARLAFQLRRLEAMREAAEKLMAKHRLGRDVFPRGMPEGIRVLRRAAYHCTIYDLLKAYGDFLTMRGSSEALTMKVARRKVVSVEDALIRIGAMLGQTLDWAMLLSFLPPDLTDEFTQRSALASTFTATLEMAKQGKLELRQTHTFGPIFLRRADRQDALEIEPTEFSDDEAS